MSNLQYYTEHELVFLIRQKDQKAFSYLYDHYCAVLNGVIVRIVGARNSGDILQEVFIKIWKCFDQYDASKSTLFTWMASIAKNCSIDSLKSKSYKQACRNIHDESILHPVCDKSFRLNQYDHLGVRNTFRILKAVEMNVLDLAYLYGCTHSEIAKTMDLPLGTVKTMIRNSIYKLRSHLLDEYSVVA